MATETRRDAGARVTPGGAYSPARAVGRVLDRFGVQRPTTDGDAVHLVLRNRPSNGWPAGTPSAGVLGVAVDSALGFGALQLRPARHRTVTTELSLDVLTPERLGDAELAVVSRTLRASAGGFARSDIFGDGQTLVATAVGRFQYVPLPDGVPDPLPRWPERALAHVEPPEEPTAVFEDLAEVIGARVEPGKLSARVVVDDPTELANTGRTVHGGVLFCLSDLAACALAPPGGPSATVSVRMNFLRPGLIDAPLEVNAQAVHRGRSMTVARSVVAGPDGRPCTIATVTRLAVGASR